MMANRRAFSVPVENKVFDFRCNNNGCRVTECHRSGQVSIVFKDDEMLWWVTELVSIWRGTKPAYWSACCKGKDARSPSNYVPIPLWISSQ